MSFDLVARVVALPLELAAPARPVLTLLAWYASEDARAWPSVATLCRASGYTRATVQRALRELERAKLIRVSEPSQGKLATVYTVELPPQDGPHIEAGLTRRRLTPRHEGPHSEQKGPQSAQKGPHTEAQSVMERHEPQSAGAHAREGAQPAPIAGLSQDPDAKAARLAFRNALHARAGQPVNGNARAHTPLAEPPKPPTSDPALIETRRRQAAAIAARLAAGTPSAGNVPILAADLSQSGKPDEESKA